MLGSPPVVSGSRRGLAAGEFSHDMISSMPLARVQPASRPALSAVEVRRDRSQGKA